MLIVPLQAVPSQTLQITLNGQACTLNVYQKFYGMFIDVYVGSSLIIGGVAAEYGRLVVISEYLGFSGDFMFVDTQGTEDPDYEGMGSRFLLFYLFPSDLPAGLY